MSKKYHSSRPAAASQERWSYIVQSVTSADWQTGKKIVPKTPPPPKIFIDYGEPFKLQLRAYIYQGRDMLAQDQDGFSGASHSLTLSLFWGSYSPCGRIKASLTFNLTAFERTFHLAFQFVINFP